MRHLFLFLLMFCFIQTQAQVGLRNTSFNPSVHGFHFSNTFDFELIQDVRLQGMCGGMIFSALDYYHARMPIPKQTYRPATGETLFRYIRNRQISSVADAADKWAELFVNPFGWRTDEFFNWGLQVTGGGRLQELKEEIDKGRPVPLGLMKPGNGGTGPHHVVLAIGYNGGRYKGDLGNHKEDLEIKVYDPNIPGEIVTLKPNPSKHYYYYKEYPSDESCHWQTYFVNKKYSKKSPPRIAPPPASEAGKIHEIILELKTGNDDLRGGNDNVDVRLNFKTKPSQLYKNINKSGRWINNFIETVPIRLTTPVGENELKSVELITNFRGGMSGDNWNLDQFVVKANNKELYTRAGSPLVRFTGKLKSKTFYMPAAPVPDNKIRELELTFVTGSDDLRGGNDNVHVTLYFSDGSRQQLLNANKKEKWNGGVTKSVFMKLTKAVPKEEIKRIELKTTFGGGIGGDNWNLDCFEVHAKINGTRTRLFREVGEPLVRFTGENKPFNAIIR